MPSRDRHAPALVPVPRREASPLGAGDRTETATSGPLVGVGGQAGIARQQAVIERERAYIRRLAKPAGYMAVGAVVAYGVILGGIALTAPGLVASVVIAGAVALIGVVAGIGGVVYARGTNTVDSSQDTREVSPSETAD